MSCTHRRAATVILTLAVLAVGSRAAWTATDLGAFSPTGLNDRNQVIGVMSTPVGEQAVTWESGTVTPLRTIGLASRPNAITAKGAVVGADYGDGATPVAVEWKGKKQVDLGMGPESVAWSIDCGGTAVGAANGLPYAWMKGAVAPLPLPEGAIGGAAYGISGARAVGTVVIETGFFEVEARAIIWSRAGSGKRAAWTVAAVAPLSSSGRSINALGVAAIDLITPDGVFPATWGGGDPVAIPISHGWQGLTCGINDAGTVLVQASDGLFPTAVLVFQPSGTGLAEIDLTALLQQLVNPMNPESYRQPNMLNNLGAFVGERTDGLGNVVGVLVQP